MLLECTVSVIPPSFEGSNHGIMTEVLLRVIKDSLDKGVSKGFVFITEKWQMALNI